MAIVTRVDYRAGRGCMTSFVERLDAACGKNGSLLCVGLDPEPALMPVEDLFTFNREIVDATRDLVCAYKPNLGFYEAHGIPGLQALQKTVEHIRAVAPDVIILGPSSSCIIDSLVSRRNRTVRLISASASRT